MLGRHFDRTFDSFEEANAFYKEHIRTLPQGEAEELGRRLADRQRKNFYRLEYRESSFAYTPAEKELLRKGYAPQPDVQIEHLQDVKTTKATEKSAARIGRPDLAFHPDNIYLTEGGKKGTAPRGTRHHLKNLLLRRPPMESRGVSAGNRGAPEGSKPKLTAVQTPGAPRPFELAPARNTAVPELRSRVGRFAERGARAARTVRLSFGADLIVQAAIAVMLGILESRLAKVNEEGIQRAYTNSIYKGMRTPTGETLMQAVESTVSQVQQGVFEGAARQSGINTNTTRLYFDYKYDLLMERQAKDVADAIVSIIRGFDFVEVFYGIEPYGQIGVLRVGQPLKTIITKEKRREIRKDIFRYRFTHRLLCGIQRSGQPTSRSGMSEWCC